MADLIGCGIIGALVAAICFILGSVIGNSSNKLKEEAVEKGFAFWKVEKNGETKFEWMQP